MYYDGEGVPQDHIEAAKWFRMAAEQGHAPAQSILGSMYYDGEGIPQNYVEGHKWLNLAASRGMGEYANTIRQGRDLFAEKMTPAQIAEAQRLAREWQPKTWEQLKDK